MFKDGGPVGSPSPWGNGSGGPLYPDYGRRDPDTGELLTQAKLKAQSQPQTHPQPQPQSQPHWSDVMNRKRTEAEWAKINRSTHMPHLGIAPASNPFETWLRMVDDGNKYRRKMAESGQLPRADQLAWLEKHDAAIKNYVETIRSWPIAKRQRHISEIMWGEPGSRTLKEAQAAFPELFEERKQWEGGAKPPSQMASKSMFTNPGQPIYKQPWIHYTMALTGLAYVAWWYGKGK